MSSQSGKKNLLLNWVYYKPVGHVVEALNLAAGFHSANPDFEIHLALNSLSACELTAGCTWIKGTYPVDVRQLVENKNWTPQGMPQSWDYIVSDYRPEIEASHDPQGTVLGWEEQGMLNWLQLIETQFQAADGKLKYGYGHKLPQGLHYCKTKLTLAIPPEARRFADRYQYPGLKLCLLPSGSSDSAFAPSVESWVDIIEAITAKFPRMRIHLTGCSPSAQRTSTGAFSRANIEFLLQSSHSMVDCYDIGLWNQVALLHACNVLLAPHTGFAFLSSCVGTPWLALSGGDWPEYLFNHSPFYCILPRERGYPYLGKGRYTKCKKSTILRGQIPPFTPTNIRRKIPEILEAIPLLLDRNFTYPEALNMHRANIRRLGLDERKFNLEAF